MSDQYTPTTEEVRLDYVMAYTDRESSHILAEQSFNRWYEAEIAAAEQRGAIKALRDAADDSLGVGAHPYKWLHDRADLLEDNDETH